MAIWHRGPRTVLKVFLDSTESRFYLAELSAKTHLDVGTVRGILTTLTEAGLMKKQYESYNPEGQPRTFYSLTAQGVTAFRMSV